MPSSNDKSLYSDTDMENDVRRTSDSTQTNVEILAENDVCRTSDSTQTNVEILADFFSLPPEIRRQIEKIAVTQVTFYPRAD